MRFFEKFFGSSGQVSEATGEWQVLCPFDHYYSDGTPYKESTASAHISMSKSLFHCKVPNCESHKLGGPNGGLSEAGFMSALQGVSYGEASRIISDMREHEHLTEQWQTWHEQLKNSEQMRIYLEMLGIDGMEEVLQLGYKGNGIVFPVFIYGEYMGACDYNPFPPNDMKKALLDKEMGQAVFPFDLWREDSRDTFLCAGFKDAAIARKNGLNAITFTHGEGSFPKLYKRSFKGRRVFICYDNDQAGRDGALRTATILKEAGAIPFIIDLSSVCTEKGEDIHDFFHKYEKTAEDLLALASVSEGFNEEDYERERNKMYPLVTLEEATSGRVVGQVISSRVSVVANYMDTTFRVPELVEFVKVHSTDRCTLDAGETRTFYLEDKNIESILKLMDSGLNEEDINKNLKQLVGIPANEKFLRITKRSWINVHKAVVVDDTESQILDESTLTEAYAPLEMLVYSLGDGNRLNSGEKYRIFYKSVTHPLKASMVVGVVTKVETSDTSVNKFKVTPEVLESVKCFQVQEGQTVSDKMKELFERSKAFLGPEANWPVFYTTELFFHTPLDFQFDEKRRERAYLDVMIVGESRTHKSATAKGLMSLYELGTFASLKNATVAGLIGGSQGSSSGGYKTRLGLIPRNHRGAIVLEEFSGASPEFIKSMTDIRSSNVVKIERVNGTMAAPAKVRMLTLSNAKPQSGGTTMPLNQYPTGVKVLLELIGAAEDIARYDFFVLKDEGRMIAPTTTVDAEAYPKESYMNRVRWIWSRTPEQVSFDKDLRDYIVACTEELNSKYNGHIQFFGREAWKKLARTAIACAACVCSYDETGEKLKITADHITWAKNWLISCYDNKTFKLKRHVEEERMYTLCDKTDVAVLQAIYNRHTTFIKQMDRGTEFSVNQLKSFSGLNQDEFSKLENRLIDGHFLRWVGDKLQPTPKFRIAMGEVQETKLRRL